MGIEENLRLFYFCAQKFQQTNKLKDEKEQNSDYYNGNFSHGIYLLWKQQRQKG